MNVNKVTLSGNLTRDPELRMSASGGTEVLRFTLAVNDRVRNAQTGEWDDYANFFGCVMFGSRAESLSKFLKKGSHVVVDGKLRHRTWTQDDQRRSTVEVIVDNVDFVGPKRDGTAQPAASAPAEVEDEDIPF